MALREGRFRAKHPAKKGSFKTNREESAAAFRQPTSLAFSRSAFVRGNTISEPVEGRFLMAKIVDLMGEKRRIAAKRGFAGWITRFEEHFDETTRPMDLSKPTLARLIRGDDPATAALHELVMAFRGLGPAPRFHYLETPDRMFVTDITLFLLDQFRFEAMNRLGWIETPFSSDIPILDLVEEFPKRFAPIRNQTPALASSHPRFIEYEETFATDRPGFVRRLIPEILRDYGVPASEPDA